MCLWEERKVRRREKGRMVGGKSNMEEQCESGVMKKCE